MHLVQILLPLYDNKGHRLPEQLFKQTSQLLARAHGGVTAYARSPALGLWKKRGVALQRDDIVVYEVMTSSVDGKLWSRRRKMWEKSFRQESIVIRAARCRCL